jgi:hypothetical protein
LFPESVDEKRSNTRPTCVLNWKGAQFTTPILVVWIVIVTLIALGGVIAVLAIGGRPDPSTLRAAAPLLDGAWRFHIGDDPHWANADADDSGSETVDLSAPDGSRWLDGASWRSRYRCWLALEDAKIAKAYLQKQGVSFRS